MKMAAPKTHGGKRSGAGRPATGRDPVISIRLPAGMIESVQTWAAKQYDEPVRSEAIRRLVEIGLKAKRN